jgi:hypothetical protein
MAKLTQRGRRALAVALGIALPLGALGVAASSRSLRASFSAAAQAFRDPSLLASPAERREDAPPPAEVEIEQPDITGDFERVTAEDLADAGAGVIDALTFPDLPIPISKRTMRFVAYFAASERGRQAFIERYRRGGRYRGQIERALRDADLPEDLLWLCAIESGFNPQAISPKGAAGLFQFMPETAARYGLAQSEFIDERRSITRSSAAGVAYLRDLFARYQRWDLALAAYNFGEDRLDEAVARLKAKRGAREASKPIDLPSLAEARLVPKETANFVPQVQAFAIVAANRGRFGLDELDPVEPFELGEIAVPAGTELRTIAKAAGVSIEVIRDYNPDLLRPSVPRTGSDVLVNVPASKVARALAALPVLLAQRESAARPEASAPAESASAAKETAAAASGAPAGSAAPRALDHWSLPNGIDVACEGAPASEVAITASVELLAPTRTGTRPTGKVLRTESVRIESAQLDRGLDRAAGSLRALLLGEAAVELRRRAAAERRAEIDRKPYGPAWTALSDRLFPDGHPLAGSTSMAPLLPLLSVVIEPPQRRGGARVSVRLTGADPKLAAPSSTRAFAGALEPGPAAPPHPREDRLSVTDNIPSPRVVFGWIGPPNDDTASPALELGVLLLAHDRFGRIARALVSERRVAVHVRGSLEYMERGSVVAIEAMPGVKSDVTAVEQELDRALSGFAERGPTPEELTEAKAQLGARLTALRARAGSPEEPKAAALARIARTSARAEAATAEEVQAIVKRVFARDHRVIVTTTPRR